MAVTLEYFDIWREYNKKYGDNVVVLIEIGKFYEVMEYDPQQCSCADYRTSPHRPDTVYNEKMGCAVAVGKAIYLEIKKHSGNKPYSITNPDWGGFPSPSYERKRQMILRHGFVIVRVDQIKEGTKVVGRKVVEVASPGTEIQEIDIGVNNYTNNVVSIYILHQSGTKTRAMSITCGVASLDVSTGVNIVSEMYSDKDDVMQAVLEINRFLLALRPKEIILNIVYLPEDKREDYKLLLFKRLNLDICPNVIWQWDQVPEAYNKLDYHKSFYGKLFGSNSSTTVQQIDSSISSSSSSSGNSSNISTNITASIAATIDNGFNSNIISQLGLGMLELGRISHILLLQYCHAHNEKTIECLQLPTINWLDQDHHLILSNNCLQQLDIVNDKNYRYRSKQQNKTNLFDVVNFTSTRLGHRMLYNRLVNPLTDVIELNKNYAQIQELLASVSPGRKPLLDELDRALKGLPDIVRYQRLVNLQIIKPKELVTLHEGYTKVINVYMLIYGSQSTNLKQLLLDNDNIGNFNNYFQYMHRTFNSSNDELSGRCLSKLADCSVVVDKQSKYTTLFCPSVPFNKGIFQQLDGIQNSIEQYKVQLVNISEHLNQHLTSKRGKPLSMDDGQYNEMGFITTPAKAKGLVSKSNIINQQLCGHITEHSTTKSRKVITSVVIEQICSALHKAQVQMGIECYNCYLQIVKEMGTIFTFGTAVGKMIAQLDFIKSGAKVALEYNYHSPTISGNGDNSYCTIKELRHPVVERIIQSAYIPNNVSLGNNQEHNGYLLYGANSTGKSTLSKAIALVIILAQAGYYVPGHMVYYPYNRIMTRLSGNDDIAKGMSSYMIEMDELRSILRQTDDKTLVLGDEICRGTETLSGTAITIASLESLVSRKCSFVFSTHMHHLVNNVHIKKLRQRMYICHLDISYDDRTGDLIINRRLKPGAGSTAYGVEVAKSLQVDKDIISRASQIRQELKGQFNGQSEEQTILSTKSSRYNDKLYVDSCCICGGNQQLHTHHLQPQKMADGQGFIQHMHKNTRSNLMVLCSACHIKVHQQGISFKVVETVSGYQIAGSSVNE